MPVYAGLLTASADLALFQPETMIRWPGGFGAAQSGTDLPETHLFRIPYGGG